MPAEPRGFSLFLTTVMVLAVVTGATALSDVQTNQTPAEDNATDSPPVTPTPTTVGTDGPCVTYTEHGNPEETEVACP